MGKLFLFGIILLLGMALMACAQPATPSPTLAGETPVVSAAPKAEWEQKWERVLVDAKKEGKVRVYAGWSPEARIALAREFGGKFGIEVEFTSFGRGAEMAAKVQAEKRAGLYIADVFGHGGPTLAITMKPLGLLGSLEPLLVLPEVLDPKDWLGGKLPFYDNDKTTVGLVTTISRHIAYNNTMIKEGEITSFKDLLKPQYKDKIVLDDPTITGSGSSLFSMLAVVVWNREEASDWLRRLIKDQKPVITRSGRQHAEWIALGKYAIGIGISPDTVVQFMALGAPISQAYPREGSYASPGGNCLAVPSVLTHPNTTTVFVNWLLSKEGQTIFSHTIGAPGTRTDIPRAKEIDPPRPGERIIVADEGLALVREEMMALASKIIDEATK